MQEEIDLYPHLVQMVFHCLRQILAESFVVEQTFGIKSIPLPEDRVDQFIVEAWIIDSQQRFITSDEVSSLSVFVQRIGRV